MAEMADKLRQCASVDWLIADHHVVTTFGLQTTNSLSLSLSMVPFASACIGPVSAKDPISVLTSSQIFTVHCRGRQIEVLEYLLQA